ncbi:hypothetical protein N656DRAFT_780501 [Canariomyces notabilis]|uniref:Uncharacterized protein n=1 Tax=Canariomyces notabilis TaxID=2074819 RepID=A0AAN6YQQ4_9PEZI|nr:hypothetical protein N656DRAFT_780501 [Canariomyces arenarius]
MSSQCSPATPRPTSHPPTQHHAGYFNRSVPRQKMLPYRPAPLQASPEVIRRLCCYTTQQSH